PLRNFAGGYHARTPERCYVFSVILIFAVLLAMNLKFVYDNPNITPSN
ncbi:MAG: accessory gene regulator B family protein, partial [Oscillospiraceae bacterium]|nr:accessory gene regulator B family protein [Oscillospiraceae bacterium]